MKKNKAAIIQHISGQLSKGKRVELSFVHNEEEYICISLDVFGTGKPEFIALGDNQYHDAIAVTDGAVINKQRLSNLFAAFPNELNLTVIPRDLYQEETV